jgi:hypothetical protein
MTTSGDTSYSVTTQSIIRGALLDMRQVAPGQTVSGGEYEDCMDVLNQMVLSWQAAGVGLWLNQLCYLALGLSQQSYNLGPTGDNCSPSMTWTQIATGAALGATSITVNSITGILNGDNIGVQLDNGALQWTTVSGTPSGSTVHLAAALTDTAAAGNIVYDYTAKIQRPLDIVEARLRDTINQIDTPLERIARMDYMQLPLKSSTGNANQFYYDPQLGNGVLYLWSTAIDVTYSVAMTIRTPIQDFVNVGDNPQFPREWFLALRTNLSVWLSPMYQVPAQEFQRLTALAKEAMDMANDFDREQAPTQFVPYYEPSRR